MEDKLPIETQKQRLERHDGIWGRVWLFANSIWGLVWLLLALIVLGDSVFDAYSPTYWGIEQQVYDPFTNQPRCVEYGMFLPVDPPCASLTRQGEDALKKCTDRCVGKDRPHKECARETLAWMHEIRKSGEEEWTRWPWKKKCGLVVREPGLTRLRE